MMKKYVLPLICLSAIGFMACSSDDDSGNNPAASPTSSFVDPNANSNTNPGVDPNAGVDPNTSVDPNAGTIPGQTSGTTPATTNVPQSGSYATLSASANPTAAATMFLSWKTGHFTTLEYEKTSVYPSVAGQMDDIFTAAYQPAGRILWSVQTGGYKGSCSVNDAVISNMKSRVCTVSEGIGYGMLLAAFQNDTEMYNRLWNYNRAFRAYNGGNLMPWLVKGFTYMIPDESSATDADLDIATSLILMYYKTQQQAYLSDALLIINDLWKEEVEPTTNLLLSGNTSMWNGKNGKEITYNLSYFSPVALRLFALVDPSHNWTAVLDAMYAYMAKVQADGTGVFPDWSNAAGVAVNPPNQSAGTTEGRYTWFLFNKESVRIPWRIAWDYYWYQDSRALDVLKTLNSFIVQKSNGDPNSAALATSYSWNLSVGADNAGTVVASHWYSAWCATGIGTNETWLKTCTQGVNGKTVSNNSSSYFPDILLTMYSQLLNGAMVKPF